MLSEHAFAVVCPAAHVARCCDVGARFGEKLKEKTGQNTTAACEIGTNRGAFWVRKPSVAKPGPHSKFHLKLRFGSPSLSKPVELGCGFQIHAAASKVFIGLCGFLMYVFARL